MPEVQAGSVFTATFCAAHLTAMHAASKISLPSDQVLRHHN
jgi:hypothetical protein